VVVRFSHRKQRIAPRYGAAIVAGFVTPTASAAATVGYLIN
jgi:hypothetical protein